MGSYKGDIQFGGVCDFEINTVSLTEDPITMAGTPSLEVYKDNGTSPSTAGVSLLLNVNGRTGSHHGRVTTSADPAFYTKGSTFAVKFAAGTVDGKSVVGRCVAEFSIQARNLYADLWRWLGQDPKPLAMGRVNAGFFTEAGQCVGGSTNTIIFPSSASAEPGIFNGAWVVWVDQAFTRTIQGAYCVSYAGGTRTAYMDRSWIGVPPVNGDYFAVMPQYGQDVIQWRNVLVNPVEGGDIQVVVNDMGEDAIVSIDSAVIAQIVKGTWDELTSGNRVSGSFGQLFKDYLDAKSSAIKAKTDNLQFTVGGRVDASAISNSDKTGYELSASGVSAIIRSVLTEGYADNGSAPTVEQFLFMIYSAVAQFAINGTQMTTKKLDGVSTAMQFQLDNASTPTSRTRIS